MFISVLIHELGHAVTARMYGVHTRSITLWLLGGVAQLDSMPRQRGAEAVVAIVGPVVSFALALIFWGVVLITPTDFAATRFVLKYLAGTNLVLAIFNLLPALPLDGGRVLRSLLALRMDYLHATQAAGAVSKVLAVGLGIFGFLGGHLMLMLIAFFVFMAVNAETQQTMMEQMLRGIRVRDLMNRNVISISPTNTVMELTQTMIRERHKGFPVIDDAGQLVGMVDLERLQGAGPEVRVGQIMSPEVPTIAQSAPAMDAFTRMDQNHSGRLVVADSSGRIEGIITRHDLIRAIQVRVTAMYPSGNGTAKVPQLARDVV